jgi:hypothetical protein
VNEKQDKLIAKIRALGGEKKEKKTINQDRGLRQKGRVSNGHALLSCKQRFKTARSGSKAR